MTTYAFPDYRPQAQQWGLVNFTAIYRDPFKGSISTADRDGEHWRVQCAYEQLAGQRRRVLEAFLLKLNGSQHRFRMRDWSYTRAGAGGGAPLVFGAGQTGKNLNIDGGPVSQVGWLLAGDKIQVGDFLHIVDADVDTDAGGLATIIVTPRIFVAPNDNDAIEIDTPTNLFVLDQDSLNIASESNIASLAFTAASAI